MNGENDVQRVGYGLVVIGAFIAALLIYAVFQGQFG